MIQRCSELFCKVETEPNEFQRDPDGPRRPQRAREDRLRPEVREAYWTSDTHHIHNWSSVAENQSNR